MGLDQYLYAEKYLSESKWLGEDTNEAYKKIIKAVKAEKHTPKNLGSVSVDVKIGYWRKSNQIHNWFVNNCQDGRDNCEKYLVDNSKLELLLDICKMVLADHSLAAELLPTGEGFFFGSTEYDEYYYSDLEDTVEIINNALSMGDHWDFYYQSSW